MGQFADAFDQYVNAEPTALTRNALAADADAAESVDELDDLVEDRKSVV